MCFSCLLGVKASCVPFQDQAGGAVFEDIPSGVRGSTEEGKNSISNRMHAQRELQSVSAGGCGADAGRTRV